jgi:hypothetical protein
MQFENCLRLGLRFGLYWGENKYHHLMVRNQNRPVPKMQN